MPDDKDRLTEQLRNKEKAEEDRYFAELSKKQVEKLRQTHASATAAGTADCPRCGAALEVKQRHGIAVDACPRDHGIWLDMGELEEITKRQGEGWLSRLILGR
jgi:NCAIR mutase (PurE)-related protein